MVLSGEGDEKQSVINSYLDNMKLTLIQKIKLKINGRVYIEHRTRPRWNRPLPFYAFKCPVHGIVIDYTHDVDDYVSCPKCFEEKYGNMKTVK